MSRAASSSLTTSGTCRRAPTYVRATLGGGCEGFYAGGGEGAGRPSSCADRPSACATSPAAGGVRGVSPRLPSRLPAFAAEEQQRQRRLLLLARFARAPSSPRFCPLLPQKSSCNAGPSARACCWRYCSAERKEGARECGGCLIIPCAPPSSPFLPLRSRAGRCEVPGGEQPRRHDG
jgi:hypothetical protein